ncbi:MAG: hypothetical protein JO261_11615, partial [Alphaproteobacteria bacterium]|nr:hypothetical protein [Alphaproteobacteria bacterium]
MGKIIAAAAAAAAFVSFSAHASNVIVFGQNRDNCGHGVLCSVDGTHGYLDNGRGRPFNASAIARWFQVDIDGKTHLKGQQGEPLRGSGAFLVLNDTGRPISLFALALADDFRGAPGDVCRGAQSGKPCNGFSAQSGTGSYRYKSQLSGADWDRCTQGKAKRRLCIGNPSTAAEFAAGRITYSWRAGSGGAIPKGAVFTIAFADWNSNAWSAPTAPPSIIMVSSNNGVPGDNESYACCASITPDGAHAVFHSGASNIPGATPGVMSVYVYGTGDASYTAIPTSLSPDDSENVVLSDDATAVALAGTDSNTDIGNYYVFDLAAQTTQVIPNCYDMTNRVLISGDGRYVVYESGQVGPCQGSFGVFVYDRSNGTATQM